MSKTTLFALFEFSFNYIFYFIDRKSYFQAVHLPQELLDSDFLDGGVTLLRGFMTELQNQGIS